jgi:hypothetical protein
MFDQDAVRLLVTVGFPLLFVVFLAYSLRVQKQAIRRSALAMERQQEAMQVQRQALHVAEENLALQHEIHGLLERLLAATERRV